ncbi:hypothetical protein Plec18170_003335 [Paecilomyces lecythidis]
MPPPPILDFSAFYGDDQAAKKELVEQVRQCCLYNGFFQITGHRIPWELQEKMLQCSKEFFGLPLEEKEKVSKNNNTWNRGYELLRSQILEEGTNPELKEGFYIGDEISTDHPYFVQKKLNSGPNQWPQSVRDPEDFKNTANAYYRAAFELAKDILRVLALTLDQDESFFDGFANGALATMRLLHYPPQPKDSDEKLSRGIGAHQDFGAVTLLLQGDVDGLQVLDVPTGEWFDVEPVKGAYVVNLGNLFMKWSNDKYRSNIHRVINKSGQERYSIPYFFSGNPDFVCDCLPNCVAEGEQPKYPPRTVSDFINEGYQVSYGRAERFKEEMRKKEAESLRVTAPAVVAAM